MSMSAMESFPEYDPKQSSPGEAGYMPHLGEAALMPIMADASPAEQHVLPAVTAEEPVDMDGLGDFPELDEQADVPVDSVKAYLRDIGKVPLLSAIEEVELAKRIEAGLYAEHKLTDEPASTDEKPPTKMLQDLSKIAEDGERAKRHLTEANLRLVVSVAKRYQGRGLPLLDLVQEGNKGLIRAVEKFDYTKGYKFSTYATWWIRQSLQRGIAETADTIRKPVHYVEAVSKLRRFQRDFIIVEGRDATLDEMAQGMGTDVDKIKDMLERGQAVASLNTPIGDDGKTELIDLVSQSHLVSGPEEEAVRNQMTEVVHVALNNHLTDREKFVITRRFGLDDGRFATLDEVGRELGLTRERIRQIEKQAKDKLRKAEELENIRDFLSED